MNVHAAGDVKKIGLTRPDGNPLRLNTGDFVAIDRDRNADYQATSRPQALYNRVNEGFHAKNETFLLHEVVTNLPIYLPDTGPTDFHLHLPPGGFKLVLGSIDRRKPEAAADGPAGSDFDGPLRKIPRSLHHRSPALSESDGCPTR